MGGAIASTLAKSIPGIHVYDIDSSKMDQFTQGQDVVSHTCASQVFDECDVVFMCLPTSEHVKETIKKHEASLKANTVIADMTSGDYMVSRSLAEHLKANRDVSYIDLPISGGRKGALNGTLTAIAAGDEDRYRDVVRPLANVFASDILHVSEVPGSAHAVKSINNSLNMLNLISTSEGLIALEKIGVSPSRAVQAINKSSGRSLQSTDRIPQEVLSRRFGYGFSLGLMSKDCDLGCSLVGENGSVLNPAFSKTIRAIKDDLGQEIDYTNVIKALEKKSGATLTYTGTPPPVIFQSNLSLLVCDMAGTTVDEQGLVYQILTDTLNQYSLDVEVKEIDPWHGAEKIKVVEHFINSRRPDLSPVESMELTEQVHETFTDNISKAYFESDNLKLIDDSLPEYLNNLRSKGVKVCLNTGYPIKIQEGIIDKLGMKDFIDGWVSAEEVGGRPKPYMIHKLMKRFQVEDVRRVAKAGDSVRDIQEGLNVGVGLNIAVLSGADSQSILTDAGADVCVENITKVLHPSDL